MRYGLRAPTSMAVAWLSLVLLGADPGWAGVADLSGSLDVGYSQGENDGVDEDGLRQRYTLLLSRSVSEYLDARISMRYFRFDVDSAEQLGVFREEIQPTGEVIWSHPWFRLSSSASRRIVDVGSGDGELVTDDLSFDWKSTVSSLPIFSLRYDIRTNEDTGDSTMLDTEDRRFLAGVDVLRERETISYVFTHRRTENLLRGLTSRELAHQLQYVGSHGFGERERWRLGTQYVFSRRDFVDEVVAGTRLIEQVSVARGLYAFDATPDLDTLAQVPALTDGNTAAATSIDIGAGRADQNVGADLGVRRNAVTAFYVSTDRPSSEQLGWTVYVSEDNVTWTLADPSPATRFNTALQRYEIEFTPLEARYVKVVTDAANTVPEVFVTEIQVFEFVQGTGELERDATSHQLSARLTHDLSDRVELSLDTSMRRDPRQGSLDARSGIDAALRMVFRQNRTLTHSARVEESWELSGNGFDDIREGFTGWTTLYSPLSTLSGSVSLTGRESHLGAKRAQESLNALVQMNAEPWSSLFFGLEAVTGRTNELIAQRQSDNWVVRSHVDAEVTRQLSVLLNWSHQETTTDPGDDLRIRRSYGLSADLNLSSTIFLRAGLDWNDDAGRFSRSQDYLASWRLLPRAAVTFSATLNDATGGASTDRITVNATVDVSPRTTAYFTYSDLEQRALDESRLTSWLAGVRSSF